MPSALNLIHPHAILTLAAASCLSSLAWSQDADGTASRPAPSTRPAASHPDGSRPATAPDPRSRSQQDPTSRRQLAAAVQARQAWLRSDHTDGDLLAKATEASLTAGRPALRQLHAIALGTNPDVETRRAQAIDALIRNISLGYLQQVRDGDVFFAGQYDPLRELHPWSGRMLLDFVVETPSWFPINLRASVIPALRDVFPRGPGDADLDALRSIARDEDNESSSLRFELACAFAQWGDPSMIAPHLDEFREAAGQGKTVDELFYVRKLAQLHYQLRDYTKASGSWTKFLRGQERHAEQISPIDYYNAACALSLAGRQNAALHELERCAAVIVADEFDDSLGIDRSMLETDPELRACRPSPRFQQMLEKAFPTNRSGDDDR